MIRLMKSRRTIQKHSRKKIVYWDIKDPEHAKSTQSKWAIYQEICEQIAVLVMSLKKQFIEI